jgi:hypothetical protein
MTFRSLSNSQEKNKKTCEQANSKQTVYHQNIINIKIARGCTVNPTTSSHTLIRPTARGAASAFHATFFHMCNVLHPFCFHSTCEALANG